MSYYSCRTAFDLPYYGVRTDRYKYIHWSFDTNNIELYDLKKDPVLNQLRNFHGGQNDKVVQAIAESYKQELQTRKIYKQELPTHKK